MLFKGLEMYSASCLCGGIEFKIKQEIDKIFICHCKQCQKAQGGAFVAITVIATNKCELIKGNDLIGEYSATLGKKRVFCRNCASPLYSAREDLSDVIRLRLGIINEAVDAKVYSQAFTEYKAQWFNIADDESLRFKEKFEYN